MAGEEGEVEVEVEPETQSGMSIITAAKAKARRKWAQTRKVDQGNQVKQRFDAAGDDEGARQADEEKVRSSRAAGYIYYGEEENVEIDIGPNMWYLVLGDGKGGCKLRQKPEYSSASVI